MSKTGHFEKRIYRYEGVITIATPLGACSSTFLKEKLYQSLYLSSEVLANLLDNMYEGSSISWRQNLLGHCFSMPNSANPKAVESSSSSYIGCNFVNYFISWIREHEEAQVMLASVLVVIGLWWLVKTVVSLLINLVFPLIMVVLAVVLVPQLRQPLLGQNYPVLVNMIRSILLKLAEGLK